MDLHSKIPHHTHINPTPSINGKKGIILDSKMPSMTATTTPKLPTFHTHSRFSKRLSRIATTTPTMKTKTKMSPAHNETVSPSDTTTKSELKCYTDCTTKEAMEREFQTPGSGFHTLMQAFIQSSNPSYDPRLHFKTMEAKTLNDCANSASSQD
jgi:hypothetical protein